MHEIVILSWDKSSLQAAKL